MNMNKVSENMEKSSFTLTFAIELLGIDVWHDCNEGWLDLGPCSQGVRLQYQLYPGQNFELDVLVWPHCAKIWCGAQYGWTRTWQFLERRWVTFTVRHAFPVRVAELRDFVATLSPSPGFNALGAAAKNDKNFEVFLPALRFGEKRYFGRVSEVEETPVTQYIGELIWSSVVGRIPTSFMDGQFDVPHSVTDIRHQDEILHQVQQLTLNYKVSEVNMDVFDQEETKGKDKDKKLKPAAKKSMETMKAVKYELRLPGDSILSGTGRIIPFEAVGNRPADLGEVVALLSSANLPAQDDLPMVFVNVDRLLDAPIGEFQKAGIFQVYVRWCLGLEVRCSAFQSIIYTDKEIHFNDHHSVPLELNNASLIVNTLLHNSFEIELRGTRKTSPADLNTKLFERDADSNKVSKYSAEDDNDVLIAICRIDASELAKKPNSFIQGEYPVFPPKIEEVRVDREASCTNDINAIGATKPAIAVPPFVVLEAQMTLQVSMGYVGCIAQKLGHSFSRMYCVVKTEGAAKNLVNFILDVNSQIVEDDRRDEMLTGFALDTGSEVFMYVEGPRSKEVFNVWNFTAEYYDDMEIWFSTAARFSSRLYDQFLNELSSFMILKMYVPLSSLLSCPTVYVRTALPSPARAAVLKIGRALGRKLRDAPPAAEMPTAGELRSFRLELCSPPKPMQS